VEGGNTIGHIPYTNTHTRARARDGCNGDGMGWDGWRSYGNNGPNTVLLSISTYSTVQQ